MKLFSHSTGRLIFITVTAAILLSMGSCSKNKKAVYNLEGTMILDVKQSTDQELINPTVYTNAEGVIAVLCGYGFEDFDEKFASVKRKFGVNENGGLLLPLYYPEDFKHGNTARISDLYTLINNQKVRGILLLGSPEGTNIALARIQDSYQLKVPYPVFSFFPQDDVLGMESTCNFVLEYERTSKEEATTESSVEFDENIVELVSNAIKYIYELPGPLPQDNELSYHVQKIVGENVKIHNFKDSETGIASINHFVIDKE